MKIRTGFVSNSSSASYIIDVGFNNKSDFYRFARDNLFGPHYLTTFYRRKLEGYMASDEEMKEVAVLYEDCEQERLFDEMLRQTWQDSIDKIKEILKKLENNMDYRQSDEMFDDFLENDGINISELDGFIRMDYYATCHNYYSELPALMKELILFNVFEHMPGDIRVSSHIISEHTLYPREALMDIAKKSLGNDSNKK